MFTGLGKLDDLLGDNFVGEIAALSSPSAMRVNSCATPMTSLVSASSFSMQRSRPRSKFVS